MTTVEVATFGETMVAIRCAGRIRFGGDAAMSIAGAESNVATGLARLGHRVRWGCRVGADESGELILRTLRAEGVDTDAVVRDPGAATGLVMFEQRLPDVTRVEYHRAGSAASRTTDEDAAGLLAVPTRILHLTGISAALSDSMLEAMHAAIDRARQQGTLISFDVNHRRTLWDDDTAARTLTPLARSADIVIASEDELGLVTDGDVRTLTDAGVTEVVIKKGAAGATAYTADGSVDAGARRVTAVNSIGAGDAFSAGYLSAVLDGADTAGRLDRGNALGAFAVSSHGDWEGLPTRDELALLDSAAGSASR